MPNKLLVLLIACSAVPPAFAASADQKRPLSGQEIRTALSGSLVCYSPAGWADAGIHEEFDKNGSWKGTYYSRGPIGFTGHWAVHSAQLCVSPDKGTIVAVWFAGDRCRAVWRDKTTGQLFLEHLDPRSYGSEPLPLTIKKP